MRLSEGTNMVVSPRSASLVLAMGLATMSTASASGIRIASNPPSQGFTTMQAAIDAAQEGDVLLVQPGTYGSAVLDGKSLSILAMPTGTPHMGGLSVINIGSTQKVVVSGLTMDAVTTPGVSLSNDAGDVRFQNCVFHGGRTAVNGSQGTDYFGLPGIDVQSSMRVVLSNCQSTGGNASAYDGDNGQGGGSGILAQGSNVVLYEGTYHGGNGSDVTNPGGNGGDACHVNTCGFFASGTTFIGGTAGRSDYIGCTYGGAGGDGIDATNSQAQVLDVTLQPAGQGYSTCGSAWFGPAGVPIRNTGGIVFTIPGTHRTLRTLAFASDASNTHITVTGQSGDRFYMARSFDMGFSFENAFHGAWMLSPTARAVARATIPASGVLTMQVQTTDVSGDPRLMVLQGWCFDAANHPFLTGPVHVELFDAAGGPDCDANGFNDYLDVLSGNDVNQNSIPDSCPGG
jgi:hypothetical protein